MNPRSENIFNVPNALSAYRLLAFPVILWSILQLHRDLFVILLCVNLITDILDGLIARLFKLETEFGARLDSIADAGTFILALAGMLVFEYDFVSAHSLWFILLALLYAAGITLSLIRFGRMPSLHLYSFKISGYLQGIFLFTYFVFGYNAPYFGFMMLWSYLAFAEELYILGTIPELRSNLRGVYFMYRKKQSHVH